MKYQAYTRHNYLKIPKIKKLGKDRIHAIEVVSSVLPFKTNNYVVNELINWNAFENDPMFILNFPQKEMLEKKHYDRLSEMIQKGTDKSDLLQFVNKIRLRLNPHPAGQLEHNVPVLNGQRLTGIQHKYRETMLFFPSQGQTCHAYCTFCFRWPQFTGMSELKFAMKQTELMIRYLKQNREITDILITGGDPMVMNASILGKYIDAVISADLPNIKTIRIGTKALTFWPYRFISDPDSEEILKLFEKVADQGMNLALMAHFNHYQELSTGAVEEAVFRIRGTGAQIRTQSPILRHINDDADVWATMWKQQVDLGMIPYYMFIARNTGAQAYFSVTLEEAWKTFKNAYNQVSGICRTVRGPSMSSGPGKIQVQGVADVKGEKVFVLNFLQGRIPEWVGNPFFAEYNPSAIWLSDLKPAFGENQFFFEKEYNKLLKIDKLPGKKLQEAEKQSA
ncbi:MAG: 4Fe-4S cluster-binding domain-containing protein [Bacteroidales bacterium]|nr:4Fe-4S cluster-binding domain-containing protein [Bacteroidales bacterium]MBN2699593.1 4Fe-4S cluster-binding domain-containing protein [Bacteroidales bacterium]